MDLLDGDRVVAVGEHTDIHDRPAVEEVELRVPVVEAVPALLRLLSGSYFTSPDDGLVDALVSAGATVARHAHVYRHRLGDVDPAWALPRLPDRLRLTPADRPAVDLVPVELAAYPPGHPDFEYDDPQRVERFLQQMLDGEVVGPFLPEPSGLVLDGDRVVAMLLVNRMPGTDPVGEPWVNDVARDPGPRYRGLGAVLLRRAIAVLHSSGEASLGLAVSTGNPAWRTYESVGFQRVSSTRRLLIP